MNQSQFNFEPTIAEARAAGEEGMKLAEERAGESFRDAARRLIPEILAREGKPISCEDVVDLVKAEGVAPENDRAFGAVFSWLSRNGKIVKVGSAPRRKGHGAPGASVWKIA